MPHCGSRLKRKTLHQTCEICTHALASEDELPDSYVKMVQACVIGSLLVCGLLSTMPVVGMIPAIVCYRIVLVSPFRAYVKLGSCFVARWLSRIAGIFLLAFFSWVPILSIFVGPVLACMNYAIYRRAFLRQWHREKTQDQDTSSDTVTQSS